jgi:hypothetical protein
MVHRNVFGDALQLFAHHGASEGLACSQFSETRR